MSYKNEWYIANRVILTTYSDDISREDLNSLITKMKLALEDGEAPIHNLVDMRQVDRNNSHGMNIRDLQGLFRVLSDDSFGWFIVVSKEGDRTARFLGTSISRILNMKARFFQSFEEAEAFLYQKDPTLRLKDKYTQG